MSGWTITVLSSAATASVLLGLLVLRAPRARSAVLLVAALIYGLVAISYDRAFFRGAYLVVALVATFAAGYFWSRNRRA